MNVFITLDYELFFGESGTPEKSIIEPTNRLINIADNYNFKCVFFVDSGYLIKLKSLSTRYPKLQKDYNIVSSQIEALSLAGHDIQLHIHPHWEDTEYDGEKWVFNLARYRLDAFSESEIIDIFIRYKEILEEITNKKIFAFRAGGWCIQPFSKLKKAFVSAGITVDSTVFYKGKNETEVQWFDFSKAKDLDLWRFDEDPCEISSKGDFLELPISHIKVSSLFFWRFLFMKKIGGVRHKSLGDGFSSGTSKKQILRLLMTNTHSVVSIDSYKASLLKKAYRKYKREKKNHFVIIGHPKAFTEYSLSALEEFIEFSKKKEDTILTFSDIFME